MLQIQRIYKSGHDSLGDVTNRKDGKGIDLGRFFFLVEKKTSKYQN
jgi:hypothetical protein